MRTEFQMIVSCSISHLVCVCVCLINSALPPPLPSPIMSQTMRSLCHAGIALISLRDRVTHTHTCMTSCWVNVCSTNITKHTKTHTTDTHFRAHRSGKFNERWRAFNQIRLSRWRSLPRAHAHTCVECNWIVCEVRRWCGVHSIYGAERPEEIVTAL